MGIYLYIIDNHNEVLEQLYMSTLIRRLKNVQITDILVNMNKENIMKLIHMIKTEIPEYKDCFNEQTANRAIVLLECALFCDFTVELL